MSDTPQDDAIGQESDSPSHPNPARRRDPWLTSLGCLGLTAVFLCLGLSWILGTESGRHQLLQQVSSRVEDASGWSVEIEDFRLSLHRGRLGLAGIRAGSSPGSPVFSAPKASIEWRWRDLYENGHWTLESVSIDRPSVDLAAPRPDPKPAPEPSPVSEIPLTLNELTVRQASVVGAPIESGWLASWLVEDLEIDGSFKAQNIAAEITGGKLTLEPRPTESDREPPWLGPSRSAEIQISGKVRGPVAGPLVIEDVSAVGDGIDAAGSARIDQDGSTETQLQVDIRPGEWAPRFSGHGRIQGSGRLQIDTLRGQVALQVADLDAEVLEPLLPAGLLDDLAARGSTLALSSDLELNGPNLADARGDAELVWRGPDSVLLRFEAGTDSGQNFNFRGSWLPDFEGNRSFSGIWRVDDLRDPAAGRIDSTLELSAPSISRFAERLRRRLPGMTLPEALPEGRLDLSLKATGQALRPMIDGSGTVAFNEVSTAQGHPEISFNVQARPGFDTWTLDTRLESFKVVDVGEPLDLCWARSSSEDGKQPVPLCDLVLEGDLRLTARPDAIDLSGDVQVWSDGSGLSIELADGTQIAARGPRLRWQGSGPPLDQLTDESGLPDFENRRWQLEFSADAEEIRPIVDPPEVPWVAGDIRLEARWHAPGFEILNLQTELSGPSDLAPVTLSATGQGRLLAPGPSPLFDRFSADVTTAGTESGFGPLRLKAEISEGVLHARLDDTAGRVAAHAGFVDATMPLSGLGSFGISAGDLPFADRGQGPVELSFNLPNFDSEQWISAFGLTVSDLRARGRIFGTWSFDPERPTTAEGSSVLEDLHLLLPDYEIRAEEPLRIRADGSKLLLESSAWRVNQSPVVASADLSLDPAWTFSDPIDELPTAIDAQVDAEIPGSVIGSVTEIFRTEGQMDLNLKVFGERPAPDAKGLPTLSEWIGARFQVDGARAALKLDQPYATRFDRFRVAGTWIDGRLDLDSLVGRLNEGELDVFGAVELSQADDGTSQMAADLKGFFDRVRYRLDYGLVTLSTGNFRWQSGPEIQDRLSANILVERGSARRRVAAGKELLNQILAPPSLDLGAQEVPDIELDIDIATIDGIRIKNNLADLHATWDQLSIEGPLAAPRTQGSIDIAPDGKIYAYGQVLRIDQANLELSGDPNLPTRLKLETTSSLQDPSIATPEDRQFLAASSDYSDPLAGDASPSRQSGVGDQIAGGLTTFYGNQIASQLSEGLGPTRIRYEPLWIFGETDPGARLVISQDLSGYVSLAVAVDVAQGRDRVYLLDLHGFRMLPTFSATVFADEGSRYGATLQQSLTFGKATHRDDEEPAPELRHLTVDGVGEVSERRLRAWAGLSPGDPMPLGSDFDLEVDIAEGLRDRGYPSAKVQIRIEPVPDRPDLVDAVGTATLGPEARISFVGDRLKRARQRELRGLYETDFGRDASMTQMKNRAIEIWQGLGYPNPTVEVTVREEATPSAQTIHFVTVTSDAGERQKLDDIAIVGADLKLGEALEASLESQLLRVRLGLNEERALAYVRQRLEALGYPDAEIESAQADDDTLRLTLNPGRQQRLTSLKLMGAPSEFEAEISRSVLKISEGRPITGSQINQAAISTQYFLRAHGYPEAEVRPVVTSEEGAPDIALEIRAEPGPYATFGSVTVADGSRARDSWIQRMVGLEKGEPFDDSKVSAARRRLLQTRNFDLVRVERRRQEDGSIDLGFDLTDKPPYVLAYGVRWDREGGFGGLIDLRRLNAGGRGIGLGARVLWLSEQKSLRLYSQVPKLLGTEADLELYGEHFDTLEPEGFSSEGTVFSAQLDFPLTRHARSRVYGRYRAASESDTARIANELERVRSPQLGLQWIFDRRNDPADPTDGQFLSLDLSRAWDLEDDTNDYRRIFAQANLFRSFSAPGGRWTWAQSFRAGAADTDGTLPRSARFFAGGQYSVRGYDEASLGPQEILDDGSERAAGGEAIWVLSQELRIPILEGVGIAAFFDAGQVWGRLDDIDEELAKSAGMGLRYKSPVGLLRLDVAVPLDKRPQDDDFEIYFGFGQAF